MKSGVINSGRIIMRFFRRLFGAVFVLALAPPSTLMEQSAARAASATQPGYLSPTSLAATKDGKNLFIACATANLVLCSDTAGRRVLDSFPVPGSPLGLKQASWELS